MKVLTGTALAMLTLAGLAAPLSAQRVLSAQSGTIHYTEGRVQVNDQKIQSKAYGPYTQLKENETLSTKDGKAELLLNPGVFLRLGENSAVTMISTKLSDTKVRIDRGDVVLEVADLPKDNAVTMLYKDIVVNAAKKGVYRFDTEANLFRVYSGEAAVNLADASLKIGKGRQVSLAGALAESKFDRKESDAFLAWNEHRDGQMSVASVQTARGLYRSGFSPTAGGWYYDPLFGMYGYVPYRSYFASPFGYYYFSPRSSWQAYQPGYGNGGGYSGWNNGGGYNGGGSSATMQAPPVPNGHVNQGGGMSSGGGFSGGGRGGAGGGMSAGGGGGATSAAGAAAAAGGGGARRGR